MDINGWWVRENTFIKGFMDYVVRVEKEDWIKLNDTVRANRKIDKLPATYQDVFVKDTEGVERLAFIKLNSMNTECWYDSKTNLGTFVSYWKDNNPKVAVTIWKGDGYENTEHTKTFDNFEEAFNFVNEFTKQTFFNQVIKEYFNGRF